MKRMPRHILTALLLTLSVIGMQAQQANRELVSKRMADAINSGKFYMKLSAEIDPNTELAPGERRMGMVGMTIRMAAKGGVSMSRSTTTAGALTNHVSLTANGYSYTLDEAAKSYTAMPLDPEEPLPNGFGRLTFMRQGTCLLNGAKYHYDVWRTTDGHKITFYYNSNKVSAIDLGVKEVGVMSLLSFDRRIPSDMYFCLSREWTRGESPYSGMTDMMGGMDIDMVFNENMFAMLESQSEALKAQGIDLEQMKKDMAEAKKSMQQNQALARSAEAAPDPPMCSSTWTDTATGLELAAGEDLGAALLTAEVNTPRTDYVYMDDFGDKPQSTGPREDLNVTDAGIWLAFDDLSKTVGEMTDAQAEEYLQEVNTGMLTAMEAGYINGEMVEYAVATCMLNPQPLNYNNTGMLFTKIQDNTNALLYFEKAEEMDPENPAILTNIGECFLAAGDDGAARRYANKALASAPQYGPALQLHTTLLLKEGKSLEAVEALFTTAAHYFSDITASQFFNLYMQLHALWGEAAAKRTKFREPVLGRIFSEKNQELLAKATAAGFNKRPQDVPENQRSFPFPYVPVTIESTYESLKTNIDEKKAAHDELVDRRKELEDDPDLMYMEYMTMGMKSGGASLDDMATTLAGVPYAPGLIRQTSVQAGNVMAGAYATLNNVYNKGKSLNMLDARQFWCLMIWQTYYRFLIGWANGDLTNTSGGKREGDCPAAYFPYLNACEGIHDDVRRHNATHSECLEGCTGGSELAVLRCALACARGLYNSMSTTLINDCNLDKNYYTAELQPLLEEYWLRMNAMTAYCDNLTMQEYFLISTMEDIDPYWTEYYWKGFSNGQEARLLHKYVNDLAAQVGEAVERLRQEEAIKRAALKKSDARLKNFGEKDKPDYGFGIPTPLGRISFMREDGQTNVSFTFKATGKTYKKNLDTGETTTMTTYTTLADEKRRKPSIAEQIANWRLKKEKDNLKNKVVDAAGRALFNQDKVSQFIPKAKASTSRQHARTVDAQGNVVDTYDVTERSYSFSGGPVSATAKQKLIRSGASLRTKNHLIIGFGGLDFTIGR